MNRKEEEELSKVGGLGAGKEDRKRSAEAVHPPSRQGEGKDPGKTVSAIGKWRGSSRNKGHWARNETNFNLNTIVRRI